MPEGSVGAGEQVGILGVLGDVGRDVGALRDDLEPLRSGIVESSPDQLGRQAVSLELGADAGVGEHPSSVGISVVELADLGTVHDQVVPPIGSVTFVGDLDLHGISMPGSVPIRSRSAQQSSGPPRSLPYDSDMARTSSRFALVLASASVALLLAGCGASGGDDASDDTTTTKAGATTTEASDTTAVATTAAEDTTTTEAKATTTAAPAGDEAICPPMKALSTSDAEANKLVSGGNWPAIQAFYVDNTDDIVAIYDEAIAVDTEITADLETLRSVTVSAGDLAASSSDLMDFSGKLASQPGLAESGQAALRANEFTQKTCGFPLAGF